MKEKIPKQLQKEDFRFVPIKKGTKMPLEREWPTKNNYKWDDKRIQNYPENIGILCGKGNLIIFDCDVEECESLARRLPSTLVVGTSTTKSGYRKKHFYFECHPLTKKLILNNGNKHLGEIQSAGQQCLIPGSIHPKTGETYEILEEREITKIKKGNLNFLSPYVEKEIKEKEKKSKTAKLEEKTKDPVVKQIKSSLTVEDVLNFYKINTSKNPTKCPWHSSKGGKCFSYDEAVWHCFHCERSGDIFHFVMEHENLNFLEAKEKLLVIMEKLGKIIKIPEEEITEKKTIHKEWFYNTSHLLHFDKLDKILQLLGREYIPYKKAIWYKLFSLPIEEKFLPGNKKGDVRLHMNVIIMTGHGKSAVDIVQEACKNLEIPSHHITISHPEQLIGTSERFRLDTLYGKKELANMQVKEENETGGDLKELSTNSSYSILPEIWEKIKLGKETGVIPYKYTHIPGWLESGNLIFAEGYDILSGTEEKYKEIRAKISQALDPIGENKITKLRTGFPKDETLEYSSRASIILQTQPIQVDAINVIQGFPLRFLNVFIDVNRMKDAETKDYEKTLTAEPTEEKKKIIFEELKTLKKWALNKKIKFKLSEKALKKTSQLAEEFGKILRKGTNGDNIVKMLEWRRLQFLQRFAAVHAALRNDFTIREKDIEKAYVDLVEIFETTTRWVDKYITGDLGGKLYGEKTSKVIEWLKILRKNNKEPTINNVINYIIAEFGIKKRNAQIILSNMEKKKIIERKRIGQHSSAIKLILEENEKEPFNFGESQYVSISKKLQERKPSPSRRGATLKNVEMKVTEPQKIQTTLETKSEENNKKLRS